MCLRPKHRAHLKKERRMDCWSHFWLEFQCEKFRVKKGFLILFYIVQGHCNFFFKQSFKKYLAQKCNIYILRFWGASLFVLCINFIHIHENNSEWKMILELTFDEFFPVLANFVSLAQLKFMWEGSLNWGASAIIWPTTMSMSAYLKC